MGFFKECDSLMPNMLSSIVLYLFCNKTTILGVKREVK